MWAERDASGIVATGETRQGIIIVGLFALVNQAQGVQVIVDVSQDFVVAFARVGGDFTDGEVGEALA
jgi:hypothetical protein